MGNKNSSSSSNNQISSLQAQIQSMEREGEQLLQLISQQQMTIEQYNKKIYQQETNISNDNIRIQELQQGNIEQWKTEQTIKLNGVIKMYDSLQYSWNTTMTKTKKETAIIQQKNSEIINNIKSLDMSILAQITVDSTYNDSYTQSLQLLEDSQKIITTLDKYNIQKSIQSPFQKTVANYKTAIQNYEQITIEDYYNSLLFYLENYRQNIEQIKDIPLLSQDYQSKAYILYELLQKDIANAKLIQRSKNMFNSVDNENTNISNTLQEIQPSQELADTRSFYQMDENIKLQNINNTLFFYYWVSVIVLFCIDISLQVIPFIDFVIQYIFLILFPFCIEPIENFIYYIWTKINNIAFITV